jgi:lycopene cyclase domain-containing protein
MSHLAYIGLLVLCLLATAPLEIVLRVGVYRRWRRVLLALVPTIVVFGGWDLAAVAAGQWRYDPRYVIGLRLPGGLPVEELLFFVVAPLCAIMTLEAVRRRRPGWPIGDER